MPRTQHHYNPDNYEETPPVGFIDGLVILLTIFLSWLFFRVRK
jgi:hypothetical protein